MIILGKYLLLVLACVALAVPHLLAVFNFRRRLAVKRRSLTNLLSDPSILQRYMDRFPNKQGLSDAESIAGDYFSTYYNRGEYISALLLNFATGCLALLFVTARIGFPAPLINAHLQTFIQSAVWADAVLWSLIGSYLWNCYDLIRRTTNFDLTPDAFTKMWLKLWIAAAVASILSGGITPALQPTVGFAIGLISIPLLFEIIADRASKVLNVKSTEGDTSTALKLLQGASSTVIDTLNDFDIENTVQLAYCDPMNVMMSTSLPWVGIIDLIDQALLFNYVGADVAKVRSGGYRGSIEVATIGAHLNGSPEERVIGLQSLSNFASLLGWPESKAIDLVQTLYADSQVGLIWDLFGGNFVQRDTSRLPDAATVKMVIKADLAAVINPAPQENALDASEPTGAESEPPVVVIKQQTTTIAPVGPDNTPQAPAPAGVGEDRKLD